MELCLVMVHRNLIILVTAAFLTACNGDPTLELPGSTAWDRNAVLAEASEPVTAWFVAEGDLVDAGAKLLTLDTRRIDARIERSAAQLAEAEARLAELQHGPRPEAIDSARANLDSMEAAALEAQLEFNRAAELLRRELTSEANVDQARAARDQRQAAVRAAKAVLEELLTGTRPEQIDQAEAAVKGIRAELSELQLTRDKLTVRAPRTGRVDALPFKPGDQPMVGDTLASLLVGDRPYARVFIPAAQRAQIAIGDRFDLQVEGIASTFTGTLRSIRSEPNFTPYYALSGDDASRLVYRAELLFDDERATDLPGGLPLLATPSAGANVDD
jgi:HlyD family secretion protein